ncbi:unnamed protein product [Heterobilharzia americana]|nr:unnamed protein product [Heterobilharzia americana]
MMSQMWQVKLVLFGLLMISELSYTESLRKRIGGQAYLPFKGKTYSLSPDYTLTIEEDDCTETVSLKPPTERELKRKAGYRQVTR